jgi:hypothetical protein
VFNCNAAFVVKNRPEMSLNRYEQALFDYWDKQPDERRHWQAKVVGTARLSAAPGEAARTLERELWEHFTERCPHVPALRELSAGGLRRVSLLNLAEHLLRLWGPPPKPKKPASPPG